MRSFVALSLGISFLASSAAFAAQTRCLSQITVYNITTSGKIGTPIVSDASTRFTQPYDSCKGLHTNSTYTQAKIAGACNAYGYVHVRYTASFTTISDAGVATKTAIANISQRCPLPVIPEPSYPQPTEGGGEVYNPDGGGAGGGDGGYGGGGDGGGY